MSLKLVFCAIALPLVAACSGAASDPEVTTGAPSALSKEEPSSRDPGGPGDTTADPSEEIAVCLSALRQRLAESGVTDPAVYETLAERICYSRDSAPTDPGGCTSSPQDACANAVKVEVEAGRIPKDQYEATLAARCRDMVAPKK